MCSLNDAEIGEDNLYMESHAGKLSGPDKRCRKCKDKLAEVVLQVSDAYCRDCFLIYEIKKFRSTLGKSKKMKPKDRVLVAYSGSQASLTLLHLLYEGVNDEMLSRRFVFEPLFVYIDEGAVLGQTKEQRQIIKLSIANTMMTHKFEAYASSLDKVLDAGLDQKHALLTLLTPADTPSDVIMEENDRKLQKLVDATCSLTSREDLVEKLRNTLLLMAAKHLKCSKIFLADVETDLAVKLLSNISLGRGAQLPLDVGFCDTRDSEVEVLRPMRNFMKKEVVFYNNFHKLHEIHVPSVATQQNADASIQKLTETFVIGLTHEFPQTVATIFRTGEKLSMTTDGALSPEESCILCQGPLDTTNFESSALQATKFSSMISNLGPSSFDSSTIGKLGSESTEMANNVQSTTSTGECCAEKDQECGCQNEQMEPKLSWAEAEEFTCYGCRHITKEISRTIDQLPLHLRKLIHERSMYKVMKKEIEDFLI